VFKILIDAFRMRQADNFKFEATRDADSVYTDAAFSITGFREFMRRAARRPNLLPPWWSAERQAACEDLGMGAAVGAV
jgi:splicing suppressor protein 51